MSYIRVVPSDFEVKKGSNKAIIEVDGQEVATFPSFYVLLAEQLDFPDYFGDNLDALYDMLTDLQWLKANTIEIYIHHYASFLSSESKDDKCSLMYLLDDVIRTWKEDTADDDEWDLKKVRVLVYGDDDTSDLVLNNIGHGKYLNEEE